MLGTGDVLVAQEQHLVLEQELADFSEEAIVVRGIRQVHADQLGTDTASELFYAHLFILLSEGYSAGRAAGRRVLQCWP
ncbi:hypothetical protein D9M69_677440 [compost metagenome]